MPEGGIGVKGTDNKPVTAIRLHCAKTLCDPSARFREHRLRIAHPPSANASLQNAGRRLLDVDRD